MRRALAASPCESSRSPSLLALPSSRCLLCPPAAGYCASGFAVPAAARARSAAAEAALTIQRASLRAAAMRPAAHTAERRITNSTSVVVVGAATNVGRLTNAGNNGDVHQHCHQHRQHQAANLRGTGRTKGPAGENIPCRSTQQCDNSDAARCHVCLDNCQRPQRLHQREGGKQRNVNVTGSEGRPTEADACPVGKPRVSSDSLRGIESSSCQIACRQRWRLWCRIRYASGPRNASATRRACFDAGAKLLPSGV